MSNTNKLASQIFLVVGLLFALPQIAASQRTRLGEPPPIEFPTTKMSQSDVQQFLEGNFHIIKDMGSLPQPVTKAFTESGGTRLTIADPGKKWEATDFIVDTSLPRKRLLFGGVLDEKCFMLYEQGGIGHFYVLALFKVSSANVMQPIWRSYCEPASDISGLRTNISKNKCSEPVPSQIR